MSWYCEAALNNGGVGKTSYFEAKYVNISKTVGYTSNVTITNGKLHMRFRLTPRSMTVDDLELYKFKFFLQNFADFGRNNS